MPDLFKVPAARGVSEADVGSAPVGLTDQGWWRGSGRDGESAEKKGVRGGGVRESARGAAGPH